MNDLEKKEILLQNGWESLIGFTLSVENSERVSDIIVSIDEFERMKNEEPKEWFWSFEHEYAQELGSAWECFMEDYSEDNNLDMSFEEVEDLIYKLYIKKANTKGDE